MCVEAMTDLTLVGGVIGGVEGDKIFHRKHLHFHIESKLPEDGNKAFISICHLKICWITQHVDTIEMVTEKHDCQSNENEVIKTTMIY